MRVRIEAVFALLLLIAVIFTAPAVAQAAPASAAPPRAELALGYSYLHANAPPGGCGCFSMNGGDASFAYRLTQAVSITGEVGAVTNGNADATGLDLTLANYLVGGRYSLLRYSRYTPFAQLLLGSVHATGSLAPSQSGLGQSTQFAMATGGGLDVNLTRHFAIRAFQAEYLLTLLPNRTNNHQNNLHVSAGVVVRFGK